MGSPHTHPHIHTPLKRRAAAGLIVCVALSLLHGISLPTTALAASSWSPTLLVNTEAFQVIDDDDTAADIVMRFGDTINKSLTYERAAGQFRFDDDLEVLGTVSGTTLHANTLLRSSGSLITESGATIDGTTFVVQAGSNNVGIGTAAPQADLHVVGSETRLDTGTTNGTASLSFVDNGDEKAHLSLDQATATFDVQSDGRITVNSSDYVNVSGSNYVNVQNIATFLGSGVGIGTSAPDTPLEVVGTISGVTVYATRSFSGAGLSDCDTGASSKLLWDATTGRFSCGSDQSGSVSAGQGLSLNGTTLSLSASISGTLLEFQTVSGSTVYGSKSVRSSGSLVWEGAASGNTLFVSGDATFAEDLTFGNAIGDAVTVNAGTWSFANSTSFVINGGAGMLEVVGTLSGSSLFSNRLLRGSGGLVVDSGSSIFQLGTNTANSAFQVRNKAGSGLLAVYGDDDIVFGAGESGTPRAVTVRGAAASGANVAGANVTFDASNGTGNQNSGDFIFRTGTGTSSGIAVDAASNSGNQTTSSWSWSHTTAGGNRLLVVGVSAYDANASDSVTGITYGGQALTFIRRDSSAAHHLWSELWYLANPPTGSNTVAVTLTGAPGGAVAGAVTFTGVDTSSPIEGNNGDGASSGASPSVSVTTVTANAWLVGVIASEDIASGLSVGASQNEHWEQQVAITTATMGGTSKGPIASPGSNSIGWTQTSTQWRASAAAIRPLTSSTAVNLSERLRLTAAGNVGIATTAPKTKLEVVGTISGATVLTRNLLNSTSATTGSILVSRTAGTAEWKAPIGAMEWYLDGTISAGAGQSATVIMPFGMTLTDVDLVVKTAPTGQSLIVDINEAGSTLFSTRPEIDAAATREDGNHVFSDTSLAAGAAITVDIDQVGSGTAGAGLTIMLKGTRKY